MEMRQNELMMEQKIRGLMTEKQRAERIILNSAVTIQRHARGFITRLKIKKVQNLHMMYEKARLDDALDQMQSMIQAQADNLPPTPFKSDKPQNQEESATKVKTNEMSKFPIQFELQLSTDYIQIESHFYFVDLQMNPVCPIPSKVRLLHRRRYHKHSFHKSKSTPKNYSLSPYPTDTIPPP